LVTEIRDDAMRCFAPCIVPHVFEAETDVRVLPFVHDVPCITFLSVCDPASPDVYVTYMVTPYIVIALMG
jgi:hypothetical protein